MTKADELLFDASDEFATERDDVVVMNEGPWSNVDDIICSEALSPAEDSAMFGERFDSGVSTNASMALITRKRIPKDSIFDSCTYRSDVSVCQLLRKHSYKEVCVV